MKSEICNLKLKKANIARALAWLLTEPDEEMAEALKRGEIYYFFSNCFKPIDRKDFNLERFLPKGYQGYILPMMKEEYQRLFQNPQSNDLWWVESVHKAWTSDPECRLSMAREKGYVMGDSALHMLELYRASGMEIPEAFSGLPDHIVLELEFLAFLIEKGSDKDVRTFMRDHLDWVSEMVKRVREYQPSAFYSAVFEALEVFIESEKKEVNKEAPCHV
ncbi:MAG: hypothetical protein FJ110_06015 [Deltaproteobacteria bacterium]|nr:hypothetical protein [Deltaproteobacteria bacterium]